MVAGSRRAPQGKRPYSLSSPLYDQIYSWKDYGKEARVIRALVRRYGPRGARSLLDVACGTGGHLAHLARWFRASGVDANPRMLSIARRKLPGTHLVVGRMQTFRLREQFDVITCLFSSIGYARSEGDLVRTLRNLARHLAPGGIVIVEPWLTPRDYHVGHVAFMSCGTREAPLVRMNVSDLRRGRSVMNMHHLGLVDGQVRHWVERHEMALFDRPTMRRAFRAAGLEVRYLSGAFPLDRGLYLGIRPPRSTRNALGTPRSSPLRPRREVRGLPLLTRGSQPSRSGP